MPTPEHVAALAQPMLGIRGSRKTTVEKLTADREHLAGLA